jgi:energy-coupling factor transporter transmembrane protein EcfT
MTHEDYSREEKIKLGSERRFGQVFAGLFALIAFVVWHRAHVGWPLWLAAAVAMLAVAYLAPTWLERPNRLWLRFGLLLAKVIQPVVLGILFFVAITPIGMIMRLRHSDLLRLKFDRDAKSYWIVRDNPPNPMSKQF